MRATRRALWLAAGLGLHAIAGPSVLVSDVACGAEPGTVKKPTVAPGQSANVPVGLRKLMDVPLRDPSICVGPDGTYYLTGTSEPFWGFNNENGIRVWKSGDMVSWQPLGNVWRYGESPWHKEYLEARKPLWAPEIHYLRNTFWLTYSMPGWDGTAKTSGSGLLKSISGRPEGPYVDMQPAERMGDEIDATLFQDDDGKVYFAWHSGKIARLKDDMSGLAEPYHWLKSAVADPDLKHHSGLCGGIFGKGSFDHVGYEGMFLFKRQGRYYLCCSEQIDGRYSCMVATSTSLLGPYSARYEAIRHGGHNVFFVDASGQWWSTFFGSPYSERAAVLPVHFDVEGHLACGTGQRHEDRDAEAAKQRPRQVLRGTPRDPVRTGLGQDRQPLVKKYAAIIRAEPGLAAYWPFDGDLADTQGRAPGKGGPPGVPFVAGPADGSAVLLEKGGFVTMGACPHLDLPQTSIELIFQLTAPPTGKYDPTLIAKRTGHLETRFSFHVIKDMKRLALWNGSQVVYFDPPGGPLAVGRWHHLAATWKPGDLRLYLDGIRCEGDTGDFNVRYKELPLQVGSSSPAGAHQCDCAVAQVAIYDRVLPAEAIARHVDALSWGRERREALLRQQQELVRRWEEERRQQEAADAALRARQAEALAQRLADPRPLERGQTRVYRGEYLTAISLPVGGIAAGPIQINGEARRHSWQIFRNYEGLALPNSFFAVRAQAGQAAPVVRALQTAAEGPFAAMQSLSFSGEYPLGWYTFEEPALPVQVRMELLSPLIPLNTKDSSIPSAIFSLTAKNAGSGPVSVSFLATQRNPIGLPKGPCGGNTNRVARGQEGTLLLMTSNRAKTDPAYGDLALATPAVEAKATAAWTSLESLAEQFRREGSVTESNVAGPTPPGQTADGAIAVPFVLPPGEERTVTFVLAWHFPNTSFRAERVHAGNMYANWWPDARAVARDVLGRLDTLTAQTRLFHDTFYRTNLPHWLLDRMTSQVAILSSMTCNWAQDGFFYAFEGCNPRSGCCPGNATHVWGYPQAHARLFPEIARRMREQQFSLMKPDGMIPVRFAFNFPAFDGICHEITATLREHQTSADPSWLAGQWPAVKKALDYMIRRWDLDEDGMLAGPQHAMDGDQGGTTSWLGGTYLCALAAAVKMAGIQNDAAAAARYERILKAGQVNQDKALFNGEYFIQVPDAMPRQDYLTGCYIDQMLGQWWALQVDLGWLYPRPHVQAAMGSLYRYNFRTDFREFKQAPRTFCAECDAGLIQGTWPRGGRPKPPHSILYTEEVMSGFEYPAACLMLQAGLPREGFAVLRAAADRYDGRLRQLPGPKENASWGYSGNPFGDDECGKFYARAMAIWGVLVACQGFRYDGPAGMIGFAPLWKPEDHASFFTAAEGWGLFTQQREGGRQHERLELRYGRLRLRTLSFGVPAGAGLSRLNVTLSGQPLSAQGHIENSRAQIVLDTEITIQAGQTLELDLSLSP